jgi:hypothetical protein
MHLYEGSLCEEGARPAGRGRWPSLVVSPSPVVSACYRNSVAAGLARLLASIQCRMSSG